MTSPANDVLLKLLLIGDMGVGKSSLLLRYIENDFSGTYISTIGVDFKVKTVTIGNLRVKLQIWDTAGQERFRTITSTYYRGADGIIIVYDVNDVRSFVNVEKWTEEAENYAHGNVARMLVGNKDENDDLKTVASHDAQRWAAKHSCLFIETSAKHDKNVAEMFDMITHEALRCKLQGTNANSSNPNTSTRILQVSDVKTKSKSKCCSGGGTKS